MSTFTNITPAGVGYTAELHSLGLLIRGPWRSHEVPRIQVIADTAGFTQQFTGLAHAVGAAFAYSHPDFVSRFRTALGAPASVFDFPKKETLCPAATALWVSFTGNKSRLAGTEPPPPATVDEFAQCERFLELIKEKKALLLRVCDTFSDFTPFVRQWDELSELLNVGDHPRLLLRLHELANEPVPF